MNSWPYLLGLVLGLYFVIFNIVGFDFSFFPGDLGDARFNTYILEHGHKYLTGQEASLWNAPFMVPEANVITYSDNLIGSAPVYSVFRGLGYDRETAFQFWFIVLAILNFTTCYLFLKWLFKNRYSAVLGAFVFAFSIALQSQMTHAQVFPRFFIPLALWMLLLFKEKLSPKYLFLAVFFLVMQFYAGIYLGFMLVIPFGILLLLIVFGSKFKLFIQKIKQLKWWIYVLLGGTINLVLLGTLMHPYYSRSLLVGGNSYENVVGTLPTFSDFFFSQEGSFFWDQLSRGKADYGDLWNELALWDHQIFPGGIAILSVLVIIAFALTRKRWTKIKTITSSSVWLIIITGGITLLIFVRIGDLSLYRLVHALPGYGSMRSLTRVINVELLFFAFAVSFVGLLFMEKYKNYLVPIFLLFMGLLVADNYFLEGKSYRTEKSAAQMRVTPLINKMNHVPEGGLISYEPEVKDAAPYFYQLDAMLAAQSLGLKAVNGYSATSPAAYSPYWNELTKETRESWFKEMNFTPDTTYTIH